MTFSLNLHHIIPTLLSGLLLATFPGLFFIYLLLLALCTLIFLVICMIDFVKRTALRKRTGLVLSYMFLTAIVSVLALYSVPAFLYNQ